MGVCVCVCVCVCFSRSSFASSSSSEETLGDGLKGDIQKLKRKNIISEERQRAIANNRALQQSTEDQILSKNEEYKS